MTSLRAHPSTVPQGKRFPRTVTRRALIESLEGRRLLAADGLFAASINFQPAESPAVAGYLEDNGAVFADRGNGLTYGWTAKETKNARIRKDKLNTDERYNTFVAFGPGQGWEIAVPDGTYSVHLAIGDPSTPSGLHIVDVEGSPLSYVASKKQRWGEWTIDVTVSDGILLVSAPSHVKHFKSDALDYVEISQTVTTPAPTPTPTPAPTPTPTATLTPTPTPTPTPTTPTSTTSEDFLYVFLDPENIQGSRNEPHEIAVYNINDGNQWVKNIPLPSDTYNIRGAAACAATGRLYIAFTDTPVDGAYPGGLLCMNLNTNAVVWQDEYPASVTPSVDRFDLTPDGSTIYLPAGEESTSDFWTIINAATGAAEGRIIGPSSSHDTIVSANGQYAYLEGQEKGPEGSQFHHSIAVVDTATNQVVKTIGPFNNVVRPFTVNASNTLVYVTENNFIGFQIGSVTTGKVLFTVPVPGRNQDLTDGQIVNHGIAITPDGNYIYLVDSSRDGVYVFDVAGAANGIAPTYVGFIPTRKPGDNPAGQPDPSQTDDPTGLPGWIMSSYQGQYMYTEGGDIISTATNTVVGNLRAGSVNSSGQTVPGDYIHSRTMIEVDFNNGTAVRTSDQFGIGHD